MKGYDAEETPVCAICQTPQEEGTELQRCMICRRRFCAECQVADFGRLFCSIPCRDLFFYGDSDGDV